MDVISVKNLTKDYRQHFWTPLRRVLDQMTFTVKEREIFGFLGPNGAGKSTTIKILLGIIYASSGEAKIFGKDTGDKEAKRRLGFLPENPYFYDYLTATQFLEFHGGLHGMSPEALKERIPETLKIVGMQGTKDMYLRSFSKGMLQRIGIAQAIIHNPDLVILDEPMTGLDPLGRKEIRDLMLDLRAQGKTVFFSTHILSDVESICDRVAILNLGKLLSCGSLNELISVEVHSVDMIWRNVSSELLNLLRSKTHVLSETGEAVLTKMHRSQSESSEAFEKSVDALVSEGHTRGGRLHSLVPQKENLEDVFVRLVGKMESRV